MSDSSTGGILSPLTAAPLDDDMLNRVIQTTLSQLSGIDGSLVRPRWPTVIPKLPSNETNWISFGVQEISSEGSAFIQHKPASDSGAGVDRVSIPEELTVVVACYGPNAVSYARRVRTGFALPQNGELLESGAGLKVVDVTSAVNAPALLNEAWQRKYEFRVILRRMDDREYAIRNLLSAQGSVDSETTHDEFKVEQ